MPRPLYLIPRDSVAGLLLALPGALLRAGVARLPLALVQVILAVCGFILLLAPLLLWISWSPGGYLLILGIALGALVLALVLVWMSPDDWRF